MAQGVPVPEILRASGGMLQKQLYVIFTTPVSGIEPILKNMKEHLDFQMDLERRGIMFGAGPFWSEDERTWLGEGMVIIRAESLAAARAIAESDPMHKSGARRFTVKPWLLNEGTVTVRYTYSDQKVVLE
jgi:hypothetical protein